MTFKAVYRDTCANECGSPIESGDAVQYNGDHELVHEWCKPLIDRSVPICGKCNLAKPCDCDDPSLEQLDTALADNPPVLDSAATQTVLAEVFGERWRQHLKWGEQNVSDFEWMSILTEEVGEAAKEANEANFSSSKSAEAGPRLRAELVQVAAVAVAFIEAIDRRGRTE